MPTINIQVESSIAWTAFESVSGYLIAECPALGIVLEGESFEEIHSLAQETLSLLFLDLLKSGELDEFLRQRGWQAKGVPVPAPQKSNELHFAIPPELLPAQAAA